MGGSIFKMWWAGNGGGGVGYTGVGRASTRRPWNGPVRGGIPSRVKEGGRVTR